MEISRRGSAPGSPNDIARARMALAESGRVITDLSDSNPTRHSLTDPRIFEALGRHIYDAIRYDPDPQGVRTAREALAEHFGGEPDDYYLTSSTSQAYSWLFTLLADPGDQIAVPIPGYPLTGPLARFADIRTIEYRLDYVHSDGWILDPDTLCDAASAPRTRAVVAVNPGNPTGAYLGGHAANSVIDTCAQHGIALISDEVFLPFTLDRPSTSAALLSFSGEHRVVTATLGGLSKMLGAPQIKLGWIRLSGPPGDLAPLRYALDRIADTFLPVSAPVAAALPEMLTYADDIVAATRARLRTNLAVLRQMLADGPYRVRRCEGGWSAVIDVPAYLSADDLVIFLMRRAHLAVHPGYFYDLPSPGALTISLLPEPAEFRARVERLTACLARIQDVHERDTPRA